MGAGKYDRFISINRASYSNVSGEQVVTWGLLKRVPAKAIPISDGERARAGQTEAATSMRFQIRWGSELADLNPKDQVVYEGKTFDINNVKEFGRHEEIEITAMARADG